MTRKAFPTVFLFLLILLGLFLRLKWWPDYLSFGFEQANDAVVSSNIFFQKKVTLLGPMTEVEGIFHSPIYYYIIGLIYFLFGKNPAWVSLFIILSNLICIPLIYLVGKNFFNKRVGLIAAVIFTFSYEVISYGLWIANASLGLPFIILTFYFFYKSFKENQNYLPFAFFFFSLAISFELIISMNILGITALYFIYRKERLKLKTILFSAVAFITPLITYPIFEIRNKFLMTNSFFKMLNGQDTEFKSILKYLSFYFDGLSKEFANIFFPVHGFFAGVIMIVLFVFLYLKLKKNKISNSPWGFILVWLLATLPTFLFSAAVTNSEYAFIGVNAAVVLLMAVFISELLTRKKSALAIFLLLFVLLANLRAWNSYLANPQKKLFDSQRGVILKDTLAAVDYTYTESFGKPFFVHTITVPLYVSKLWDYLYSWRGQEKFGRLPTRNTKTTIQYLIIEPGSGLTFEYFKQKAVDELNLITVVEGKKQFGKITVEKRHLLK